jgi:hypothetical protein
LRRPSRWSRWSFLVVVVEPVLLGVVQRVDHFGHKLVLLSDLKHCARIFVAPTVISSGKNCEQLAAREAFEAVHNTFVCSQNEAGLIILQEKFDAIGAEFDDVTCAVGVADKIRLDTEFAVGVGWVGPKNVNDELLLGRRDLVNDLEWSLDCLNLFKYLKGASNTSMKTYDSIVYNCRQWQPVKNLVDFVKDRVWLIWLLSKTATAFISEAKCIVDPLVFVVASQKMDLIRELGL